MQRQGSWLVLIVLWLLLGLGCTKPGPNNSSGGDLRNLEADFRRSQTTTSTPHGRIKLETIHVEGNMVQYETETGEVFQVRAEKRDGRYWYSNAVRIK